MLLFIFSILTQGCSTIIHGSRQDLAINTSPQGATARVDTQSCITPCALQVSRLSENIYIADGNTEKQYTLSKTVNGLETYIGNIIWVATPPLFGILIGAIVDSKTGAKYTIEPVNIILPKDQSENKKTTSELIKN